MKKLLINGPTIKRTMLHDSLIAWNGSGSTTNYYKSVENFEKVRVSIDRIS